MYASIRYQQTLVTFQVPWNKHRCHCHNYHHHHIQVGPLENKLSSKWRVFECAALSKQGQRFLSSLATAAAARDNSATNRLIKKFVAASPKSIVLDALSHLLSPNSSCSHLSSLAFPVRLSLSLSASFSLTISLSLSLSLTIKHLQIWAFLLQLYLKIQEAHWFDWNPKLVAEVVALLDKQGQYNESGTLISDSISKLKLRERDLALFYCNLVESHSKQNCVQGFEGSFARLNQMIFSSNSVYIKKQAYKFMISGLCEMGRPKQAQGLIEEMRGKGVKPSVFEFRCVIHAYGKLGLFQEMQMILDQMESGGFKVDTVCSNMVLSSYGVHNALPEIALWLKKMKDLGIPFSSRTCNSVLNSCPTIKSIVQNSNASTYPISIQELMKILRGDEAMVVNELILGSSSVLEEAMKWDALESKLDLHGMHLCSAYLIMLLWFEEMKNRFNGGNYMIPPEITVVCGSGNHSIVRGESPVKRMIKNIMVQTRSPMRVDRKNLGCFIAKGKVVKDWLC